MTFLDLQHINFKYPEDNNTLVIKDFSCSFNSKDIVKLEGRNGSGKSTLMKLIAGELTPSSGTLESVANPVYLNQNASLFLSAHLSIFEQLYLPFKNKRSDRKKIKKDILDLLAKYELSLDDRADEFIGHLSGGQKQIIALLSVLLGGYNLLCLDEFTSGMDEISKAISIKILNEFINKNHICVIEVSHNNALQLDYNKKINL